MNMVRVAPLNSRRRPFGFRTSSRSRGLEKLLNKINKCSLMVATALMRYVVLPRIYGCTKKGRKNTKIRRVSSSSSVASSHKRQRTSSPSETASETSSAWNFSAFDGERSCDAFSIRSIESDCAC